MNLLCRLFGHRMNDPSFSPTGKWFIECERGCGPVREGIIPPQHQHILGNKKHTAELGYYYACACGHTEKAPLPVKRKAKVELK